MENSSFALAAYFEVFDPQSAIKLFYQEAV